MASRTIVTAVAVVGAACSGSASHGSTAADGDGGALAFTTTIAALTANNTSASSAFRDSYTPAIRLDGSTTPVSNGDAPAAPVVATDLTVGAISKQPVRDLLYPGATTQIFAETQDWFCTGGATPIPTDATGDQCGSHIDVGYASNDAAHAQRMVADMQSRGIDGTFIDWGGPSAAINTGAMLLIKAAAEATGGTFKFAAIEDQGIKGCTTAAGCDVTTRLLADIAFLDANVFSSRAYLTSGGRPVLLLFNEDGYAQAEGQTINWTLVRATAAGHPLLVFENAGGFTNADADAAYAWLSPTPIASYPGSDPYGLASYLPDFYTQAAASTKLAWASAYKGFDDVVVNGWNVAPGKRMIGQQCGKTFVDTLGATALHYSAANQLAGMQLVTWDDYEEGTELETGIDNHVAVTASLSGTTLAWTIALASDAPAECTAAGVATTLDHITIYASLDGTNLAVLADDLPPTTTSFDVSVLPPGTWMLQVYVSAKSSITNQLSNAVMVVR